jgi:hypothetical protein
VSDDLLKDDEERNRQFSSALNRHGYIFQNVVLAEVKRLFESGKSVWFFEASEFPVNVHGHGTRIDFILPARSKPWWFLAECKRVNPAYGSWCFAKSRYVAREFHESSEIVEKASQEQYFASGGVRVFGLPDFGFYNIAFVAKASKEGDSGGGSGDAIEEAATQVCRGMNGMVDFLKSRPATLRDGRCLLPVIFTTAELYVTEADLSDADMNTGKIDSSRMNFVKKSVVYYQYHLSPGVKHGHPPLQSQIQLSSILSAQFIRTIPIVSACGIEQFLKRVSPENFIVRSLSGE